MTAELRGAYVELADEHKNIVALVEQLARAQDLVDLVPMLEQLHELLIDHFSHEQFPGGLYERLGAHGPEHRDQLKELIREHCEILSGVRGLVERSRVAVADTNAKLRNDVAHVLAALSRHEQKEHLLAESLLDGESRESKGGGD